MVYANFFRSKLLEWHNHNVRPMPWKDTKDPYTIWLSEIILQQTRVEQGTPYYLAFIKKYPTIHDLARADEDEVMKLWQGLGYYTRARNLHYTAKYINNELGGHFPKNYEDILKLKGVGAYTAAAIASFAFDLPHAVLDGNVYRGLSRFFGIKTPIDSNAGKKQFFLLANKLILKDKAALYNQAIMNFGALCCTPANPDCSNCPLQSKCYAHNNDQVNTLPVKTKKIVRKHRFFNYLIIKYKGKIYLEKRSRNDIWKNLYQFPLIETSKLMTKKQIEEYFHNNNLLKRSEYNVLSVSKPYSQILTHQKIAAIFCNIEINNDIYVNDGIWQDIDEQNIHKYAFPKIIDCYLSDKHLTLNL